MALVQTIRLAHTPSSITVFAALYKHVTNSAFLREQLLAGNQAFEYAFIDASIIISTTHVLAAAFRAINDMLNGRLRTRNVHSETVFCLSPNNNIASSLNLFGITQETSSVLVLKISHPSSPATEAAVSAHLSTHVQGTPLPFTDASMIGITDVTKIRKAYKLNATGKASVSTKGAKKAKLNGASDGNSSKDEHESSPSLSMNEKAELEVFLLGAMALKGS